MQKPIKRLVFGAIALTLTFGLTACGNLADKAVEKAIEKSTGGELDIDSKDGSLKVKTDEGDMEFKTGSELPKDLPHAIPLPRGGTLMSSTTMPGMWSLHFEGVTVSDFESVKSELEAAGGTSSYETKTQDMQQLIYEVDEYLVQVIWSEDDGTGNSLAYTITQQEL